MMSVTFRRGRSRIPKRCREDWSFDARHREPDIMDRWRIVGEWVEPITRTFKSLLAKLIALPLIRTNGGGRRVSDEPPYQPAYKPVL